VTLNVEAVAASLATVLGYPSIVSPGSLSPFAEFLSLFLDRYNKICGHITKLTAKLKDLKPEDEFRIKMTDDVRRRREEKGMMRLEGGDEAY